MSLSQKHSGLILVPWFNSDEWRYVYRLVYSKDMEQQRKALKLLKIWKLRTPILSAGVEGTLILLDVLMLNIDTLTTEQVTNLYAMSLMRFLNLSAANSEKQGSFARTTAKNELPKWLINLRHDIAHGLQIPSLDNLKMGLDFGLEWLKNKYWEPQSKLIRDYYIQDNTNRDRNLLNSLKAYVEINVALFENQELDSQYLEDVKHAIYRQFKKSVTQPCFMLDFLLEMISESLETIRLRDQLSFGVLISPKTLLQPHFETVSDEESEAVEKSFRNIWQSLLNVFHKYGLLCAIIDELVDVTGDISYSENTKKMAALWINEILISLEDLNVEQPKNVLQFQSNQYSYIQELSNLQKKVLNCPNKYTVYFLDRLLKYTANKDSCNDDILNLVQADNEPKDTCQVVNKIYKLEDLKVDGLTLEDVSGNDLGETSSNNLFKMAQVLGTKKWRKIEDTSIIKNCPLGVLPHQIGQMHPFLIMN